jgi:hypothetical protein
MSELELDRIGRMQHNPRQICAFAVQLDRIDHERNAGSSVTTSRRNKP